MLNIVNNKRIIHTHRMQSQWLQFPKKKEREIKMIDYDAEKYPAT